MGVMSARRLSLVTLVSLCAFSGGVLFSAPVALAVSPPVIEEKSESVSNVAGTSATFKAKVDPEGSETTYRFEYGTSGAYGSKVPVPDGIVGSGSEEVSVSAHPQDLVPSTTYHYRIVATNTIETVVGSDQTFVTQPAGSEFALPDGRQWELVSPPNKNGALIFSLHVNNQGVMKGSEDGSAIAYLSNIPIEVEPQGYELATQIVSRRGAQGWSSRDVDTPHNSVTGVTNRPEYLSFTGDLSAGLVEPIMNGRVNTLLSSEASETTPYVRRESLCDAPATAAECYLPLLTGKEGFADVPPGTEFGRKTSEGALSGSGKNIVQFGAASPDLRHIILSSEVALTNTGGDLYEWSAGVPATQAVQSVSVLPASEGGEATGKGQIDKSAGVGHGVSVDGSRVFWFTGNPYETAHLYMRDMVRGETVRIGNVANFQFASSDGSKVFFTEGSFVAPDLYECDFVEETGKLGCHTTHLAGGAQPQVVGASEDGSYLYFASGIDLEQYHEGAVTFIAELSPEDEWDWGGPRGGAGTSAGEVTARVSADGRYVAFMSARPLTGYDNRDAVSGKPDEEVYLYDAASKRLVCTSCNPTGSRPTGLEVFQFEPTFSGSGRSDIADVSTKTNGTVAYINNTSVAANLPEGDMLQNGESFYRTRSLSDSGRLFFNSMDALVPQDVNGNEDVYEFEPEGVGSCSAASTTFNKQNSGCVSLVSSGSSPEESGFLDASSSGGDVFFLTESRLSSQDYDTAFDVYDAHECSASVPCAPAPVSLLPCSSGDSCKASPSPQPTTFGAPASATFTGSGNIVGSSPVGVVGARSLTRARRLAGALRACRGKPRRKRAVCERQARKRYGAKAPRKSAAKTRKVQG
jgi:hypothetical protein